MIRVTDLSKTHAGAPGPALDRVSFELATGDLAVVVGRSGSGKSTLLRCVVGLETFDAGTIEIDGSRMAAGDTRALHGALRGRVGLVLQSYELFPHLSVLANCVLAPIRVHRVSRAAAEERARALLAKLGVDHRVDAWPEMLSGGERQRVAIARALAMDPRVLLYDEPTSALDPTLRAEVKKTLEKVCATGVTQIVVTHDVALARTIATQVLVMHGGRIVERGAPSLLDDPAHEATRALVTAG